MEFIARQLLPASQGPVVVLLQPPRGSSGSPSLKTDGKGFFQTPSERIHINDARGGLLLHTFSSLPADLQHLMFSHLPLPPSHLLFLLLITACELLTSLISKVISSSRSAGTWTHGGRVSCWSWLSRERCIWRCAELGAWSIPLEEVLLMIERCCFARAVFTSAGWGFAKGPEGTRARISGKFTAAPDSFQYCSLGRWQGSCAFQKAQPGGGDCCCVTASRDGAGLLSRELS